MINKNTPKSMYSLDKLGHTTKIPFSVAPMMDWTDRHCRFFHRQISESTLLYTEMVTTGALLNGDFERFLRYNEQEHPLALQLGGSNPQDLAECAKMGADHGYDEINLNCGCPSDRVQKGRIGAILMEDPYQVAKCIEKMVQAVAIPVTVKCRIGIDEQDHYEFLEKFIRIISSAGCSHFIIHARKAWLQGLSPKENRVKPPINYDRPYQIKKDFPSLTVSVNGDIKTIEEAKDHLRYVDSVMMGREAYQNPYILAQGEKKIFNAGYKSRQDIALSMVPYIAKQKADYGTPVKSITRHMTGLFQGIQGAKKWRQLLSTLPHEADADETVIYKALEHMGN